MEDPEDLFFNEELMSNTIKRVYQLREDDNYMHSDETQASENDEQKTNKQSLNNNRNEQYWSHLSEKDI